MQAKARALLALGKYDAAMQTCQFANKLDYDDNIFEIQKQLESAFSKMMLAKSERDSCAKAVTDLV